MTHVLTPVIDKIYAEKRLRELLQMELELESVREVVRLARSHIKHCSEKDLDYEFSNALNKYDEARRG